MKYLEKKFSILVGSDDYRENWDKIFKHSEEKKEENNETNEEESKEN